MASDSSKREIKIYHKTYQLPVLAGGSLDQLQKQIRKRNEHLSQGKLVIKKVEQRGFFSKKIVEEQARQSLTFEERYQELNAIVKDYDSMVAMLKLHQSDYQRFFQDLAQEIREIITNNCQVIAEKEQKRGIKERQERAKPNPNSQSLALLANMKGQLLEITKSTGYAAVLMLKKLELMSKSLERIANDQETQRQFLASVLEEIRSQKDLYELQLEINALQADTAKLVDIALNFDEYMKPFMGNFQTLLNNVAQVDQELSKAMGEINNIARLLESQQFGNLERDQESQRIADFLITGELKKDRLQEALDSMDRVASGAEFDANLLATGRDLSLEDCLANIREFVGVKLENMKVVSEVIEVPSQMQMSSSVLTPPVSPQIAPSPPMSPPPPVQVYVPVSPTPSVPPQIAPSPPVSPPPPVQVYVPVSPTPSVPPQIAPSPPVSPQIAPSPPMSLPPPVQVYVPVSPTPSVPPPIAPPPVRSMPPSPQISPTPSVPPPIVPPPVRSMPPSETMIKLEASQQSGILTEILPREIKLELVKIPAGSFLMGSNEYDDEKPPHKVTLKEFYLGKYPITQEQYQAVMGNNPSNFQDNPKNPVEQVSWHDAKAFCQKLQELTGKDFRLPTEAEWEYACRAGTQTRYYFGDDESQLGDYAWYDKNSGSKTHPVGEKKPNDWGLYDMHGNVWEWCEDDWHQNYENAPTDGTAWNDNRSPSIYRVVRGGSWYYDPRYCRSAYRNFIGDRSSSGFRVVSPQNS